MFYHINEPVVDMRAEPSLKAKVVSQALFAEEIGLGEQRGGWQKIITPDHYVGWIPKEAIIARERPYPRDLETSRLSAHVYEEADIKYGPLLTLPHGVPLKAVDLSQERWLAVELPDERKAYIQRGDVAIHASDMPSFAKQFLGLPYTWGGRSSFGFDCSGFVQMVYRKFGLFLPRDSGDQAADARAAEIAIEDVRAGDLLFWGLSKEEIRHVGIALGKGEFIHATVAENLPFLRISKLSDPEWNGAGKCPFRMAKRFSV